MHSTAISALQKLIDRLDGAYAPNTLRAYRADMMSFIAFCEREGWESLPASAESVSAFLSGAIQDPHKTSTIKRKVSSISAMHRLSNLPDPTKTAEVKIALRRISRQKGTRFDQAYPINKPLLKKLLAICTDDLIGKRNAALLRLAYDSLRRRSELVSLRVEDIEWGKNGASILLRRSKTDQTGSGQWIHVTQETATALRMWIRAAGIGPGLLLRGVKRDVHITESLSGHQIGKIFKALARRAGLNPASITRISGHSIRIGSAQDLMIAGASMPQIMVKGGWSKTDTVLRYVQRVKGLNL